MQNTCNLGPAQHDTLQNLDMLENQENQMNILDDPITENNILIAAKKLKNKKSAYSDKIKNEMIKSSAQILLCGSGT